MSWETFLSFLRREGVKKAQRFIRPSDEFLSQAPVLNFNLFFFLTLAIYWVFGVK